MKCSFCEARFQRDCCSAAGVVCAAGSAVVTGGLAGTVGGGSVGSRGQGRLRVWTS